MPEETPTWGDRVVAALLRGREASRRRRAGRRPLARGLTAAVCAVAAFLVVVSTVNARGSDLRPGRNTDLVSLVADQSRQNAAAHPPGHRPARPGGRADRRGERGRRLRPARSSCSARRPRPG